VVGALVGLAAVAAVIAAILAGTGGASHDPPAKLPGKGASVDAQLKAIDGAIDQAR
jgi:hypothetical protein